MKLAWGLSLDADKLWCRVLRGKYSDNIRSDGALISKQHDSSLWKKIVEVWPKLQTHGFWVIGDGRSISVWRDSWIIPGRSIVEVIDHVPPNLLHLKVSDLGTSDGNWNLHVVAPYLSADCLARITALLPPCPDGGADVRLWPGNSAGEFTIASSYGLLVGVDVEPEQDVWRSVWRIHAPERVRCFIWLVAHNRLLTNDRKAKMGLRDAGCDHCDSAVEDVLHVLRDCPLATEVWFGLVRLERRTEFFCGGLDDWIRVNLSNPSWGVDGCEWQSIWAFACHSLWTWKNKETHDENFIRPVRPWRCILALSREYNSAVATCRFPDRVERRWTEIAWRPPDIGWVSLNTDGAVKGNGAIAGCGGLVRNHLGVWLGGYAKYVGVCSVLEAELWGILEGLRFCRARGWNSVKVQVDSQVACRVIAGEGATRLVGSGLVREIQKLIALSWVVNFEHTYREANQCADALASFGCRLDGPVMIFEQSPPWMDSLLLADCMGVSHPRCIAG